MSPTIITPQKECEFLEICNFKEGMMSHCNIFNQRTDKCIIFKLMKDNQELMYFKQQIENKKTFKNLTEPLPSEFF